MDSKKTPTLKSAKIKVGITLGDPSGIGPAITLKAIQKLQGLADFVLIGDEWVFNKQQTRQAGKIKNYTFIDLDNVFHKSFSFGRVSAEYGKASIQYLEKGLELIKNKEIDCLVTAPISKEAVNLAGMKFSGHTEYLDKFTKTKYSVMMLLNRNLKISLLTRHIPLADVSLKINPKLIINHILIVNAALKKLFLIRNPRLVICGLNQHASDNGVIGHQENAIIKPVIEKLRQKFKVKINGPISSDVAFYKLKQKYYDCAIAIYHDQALIPLKLNGFDTGVNLTLGLPFVRTSPLHGTAFDIANAPHLINPNSMIEAMRVAIKCTLNQRKG